MNTETFSLGAILTVTTGRLLCSMGDVYQILDFMTGDQLMTHQLPRATGECEGPLLLQHPQLADIDVPDDFKDAEDVWAWLAKQEATYGSTLPVQQLASEDHTYINPLVELQQMTDKPIIVVRADEVS